MFFGGNFISMPRGERLYLSVPLVLSARMLENYLGEFHFFGLLNAKVLNRVHLRGGGQAWGAGEPSLTAPLAVPI